MFLGFKCKKAYNVMFDFLCRYIFILEAVWSLIVFIIAYKHINLTEYKIISKITLSYMLELGTENYGLLGHYYFWVQYYKHWHRAVAHVTCVSIYCLYYINMFIIRTFSNNIWFDTKITPYLTSGFILTSLIFFFIFYKIVLIFVRIF